MFFEWDDAKAASNFIKHGVTFEDAAKAFDNPNSFERIDNDVHYGEVRVILIGLADRHLLSVTFTERGETTRLISARRASKHEHRIYNAQIPR